MKTKKEIIELGFNSLSAEIDGLKKVVEDFPEDFAELIAELLKINGRIIMTGIGKSAIIAQKITATLNSTGSPSVFMHAAEAIHGDLGIVQQGDYVICLSHSGNTPEIKYLSGLIKKMKVPIACITGNRESVLAKNSNKVLDYHIEREACPLNLAPTTSSTIQLALGDAVAIALLSCKNFTSEDFSKFHPGGNLGKKLYLSCGEIAEQNNKPMTDVNDGIKKAIIDISEGRLGATAVFDKNRLVGIITDGDIRRMLEKDVSLQKLKAKDIMSKNPVTLSSNLLAAESVEVLKKHKISQIIIADDSGNYIGIVHIHDLYKEGLV